MSPRKNNIGIFNSRAHMQSYVRSLRAQTQGPAPIRMDVDRHDLETLAKKIAAKYDVALFHKCAPAIREYERQLVLLAEYVGVML